MRLTPDGARYLAPRPPSPFHLRVLVPFVCRSSPRRWLVATRTSLLVASVLSGVLAYQCGASSTRAVVAALLVAGTPWFRFLYSAPVLVDGPALASALAAAVVPRWWLVVPLAFLAGAVNERGPLFAALFAWSPIPLVGLAVPLAVAILRRPGPDVLDERNAWILAHPIAAGRQAHAGAWRDPKVVLAPWGVLLVGARLEAAVVAVLAAAYAQLLVATDSTRLFMWAAPVLAARAVGVIPEPWLLLALVVHWTNPLAGNGV